MNQSKIMNEKETAEYIGMSRSFLRQARMKGDNSGPPFLRLGRSIRYRGSEVDVWLQSKSARNTFK